MGLTGISRPQALAADTRAVQLPAGAGRLGGVLAWPDHPAGFVLFTDLDRNERIKLQNIRLAAQLRAAGIGTLLLDLAPVAAGSDGPSTVDGQAERLRAATAWLAEQPEAADLPLGYLGASSSAAAIVAAATSPVQIDAVVARGGWPNILGERLSLVRVPTLLIVGSMDDEALRLNRAALVWLNGPKRLVAITGADCWFEAAGSLEEVGRWASEWFVHYLVMERAWQAARR